MTDIHTLEMPALLDLLSTHTAEFTKILIDGTSTKEEFETCKMTITLLQKEIEYRKQMFSDNTSSTTRTSISPDYTE